MNALAEAPPAEADAPEDLSQLPLFEGHRVTETRLNFSGNILVTRETADALELGADVTLTVKGRVVSATHRKAKDGHLATDSRAVYAETVELG